MNIVGYYYLHVNRSLIYKRDLGDTIADLRESDFVKMFWPFDPEDRESAWTVLVGALALGADKSRILELADKWHCTDEDAAEFAKRIGVSLGQHGAMKSATPIHPLMYPGKFRGSGEAYLEAIADLVKQCGYKAVKMWGATIKECVESPRP